MATNVANQLASIQKQKLALQKKEEALLKKSYDKVITKIVQLAKEAGLTASDIAKAMNAGKPAKAKTVKPSKKAGAPRGPVPAKYRNPANHAETWTGRGKPTSWAKALMDAGTLESALIAQPTSLAAVHTEAPATH